MGIIHSYILYGTVKNEPTCLSLPINSQTPSMLSFSFSFPTSPHTYHQFLHSHISSKGREKGRKGIKTNHSSSALPSPELPK